MILDGYKESLVGLIPNSWDVTEVGKVADVKGGKRLPKGRSLLEEPTPYPYIRVSDMDNGGVDLNDLRFVPEDIYPSISRYTISSDDLYISVAGTLGLVGYVPQQLDGANLTENANKTTNIRVNKDFLFHLLRSDLIQGAISAEATNNAQPKLALSRIKGFVIPNPPLPEQKKIARILSSVDSKLALIDQQITTTQTLKKGLMQKLFTQGVGTQDADGRWQQHTEFQETELGCVPKGWRVMPVGKVLAINNNLRSPISKDQRKEIPGPYPYYGPTKQQYSIATYEQDGTYALIGEDGDHFLKFASMPMTQLVHGKCTVNNHAHVLGGTEVCSAEWFYCFFMNRDIVNFLTRQGAGRYKLNKAALEKLLIAVPKKEEQEEIIKTIKSVSLKISYLQSQKAQTQQLKKGLMQKLLTGQIRVQPDPQDH